ncbi:DUF6249 domain-containing protein [Bacteroidota bacterium]
MAVAIIVPVTFMLVTGIVLVTYFYLKSREKQIMIEKGMSYEQMVDYLKTRRNPYTLLKAGIITVAFGLGVGLGVILENAYWSHDDGWPALTIFVFTGIGMIVAFFVTKKYELQDNGNGKKK